MDIDKFVAWVIDNNFNVKIYRNKSIKSFNLIGIGGIVNTILMPNNMKHFISIMKKLHMCNISYKIIGYGANILFADNYYNGIIIVTKYLDSYVIRKDSIIAEMGLSLPRLSQIAINICLSGLEPFRILPSSIGASVVNNVSCFNKEIIKYVDKVIYLDGGYIKSIRGKDIYTYYHGSIFKDNSCIILKVSFKLIKDDIKEIIAKTNYYTNQKRSLQPLNEKSLGSVFKRGENYYPARLIDELNLKGYSVGDAEISRKHAGFFINKGNATYLNMVRLIEFVKRIVYSKYKIELEEEIEYFGE